jgi:hypothetical protein
MEEESKACEETIYIVMCSYSFGKLQLIACQAFSYDVNR